MVCRYDRYTCTQNIHELTVHLVFTKRQFRILLHSNSASVSGGFVRGRLLGTLWGSRFAIAPASTGSSPSLIVVVTSLLAAAVVISLSAVVEVTATAWRSVVMLQCYKSHYNVVYNKRVRLPCLYIIVQWGAHLVNFTKRVRPT